MILQRAFLMIHKSIGLNLSRRIARNSHGFNGETQLVTLGSLFSLELKSNYRGGHERLMIIVNLTGA